MSVAQLGLAIDSSPAKRAAVDLDALTQSAERVENATKRATASAAQNATATGALAARLQGVATANDNATAAINRHVLAIQNLTAAEGRLGADAYASRAADVAAYGTALDGLRAKFNPVYSAIQQYKATLGEIRQAHAVGAISVNEMTAAIDRERSATLRAIEAAKGLKAAQEQSGGKGGISEGQRRSAAFNVGQQGQDIFMMSLLGQDPRAVGLQQGPQLATAIQQGGGIAALGAGLAQVFSLTTLITVGAVTATAATVQWFMKGKEGADDLEKTLKGHSDTLRLLKQQYGELGEASSSLGTVGGAAYTDAQARKEIATIQAAIRSQSGDMSKALLGGGFLRGGLFGSDTSGLDELLKTRNSPFQSVIDDLFKSIREGNGGLEKFDDNLNKVFDTLRQGSSNPAALNDELQRLSDAATSAFGVSGKFAPFQGEIDRLLLGLKEGNGDISTFATNVRRIGELNGVQKVADDAILSAKEVVALAEKLREVQDILQRIDREDTRPGLRDLRTLPGYVNRRDAEVRQLNEQTEADRQLARARTNAERLAAVEAQVRARARQDGDSGGGLQARVDRAVAEERNRQQIEARDAATQRSQAMARTLQQQRDELDLIGKTAGEQAKLRFEFERMQQLRDQAARTGDPIDDKEVEKINAAAKAMGLYADALARARLRDDLGFEARQLGRSDLEQSVAGRLRQSGLGEDLNGPQAALIRSNELLKKQVDLWKDVRKGGMDAYSDIFDLAFDGFDNWKERLSDIAKDMAKSIFDLSVKNPFLNEQYGANLPTMDQAGGLSGFFGTMLGLTPNPATGLGQLGTAANPMYVVPVGGLGGGADAVTRMFSPANSNLKATDFAPMSLSGIGSPGSLASNAPYSVANATSFIEKYAAAIGIDPGIALKVARSEGLGAGVWQSNYSKGGFREPSFGPFQLLKGGQGTGFGTGLGNRFMAQTGLDPADPANWQKSTAFALDQAKQSGWGAWFGAKKQGITGFDGIDRSAKSAVGALDNLTAGTMDAGKGLNALGGGMDKLGNLLSKFPSAPGGSGGGGLLGSLFGGLSSAFSGTSAFSWLSANPGGSIGLYADGTENAPAGWAWVGERGPELRKLRAGDVIRSNPRSMEMAASAQGGGSSKTEMHFHNAPAVAHQQESDDGEGGKRMDIWFEQQTAKATSRRGSAASKALASMGLTRPMKVR